MRRLFAVGVSTLLICGACRRSGLPEPGSKKYAELCSSFYLGLAGLQAGEDGRAKEYLTRSTQIAPEEPAGWADLGILQVRQQEFDAAFSSVEKARSLAPEESRLEALLGLIESRRGKLAEAEAHFKKAIELDPHNLKAMYSLAEETERNPGSGSQAEAERLLQRILEQRSSNQAVLLEDLRLAALRNDMREVQKALAAVSARTGNWPPVARQQLDEIVKDANSGNLRGAAIQAQFLRNVLLRAPGYRDDLDEVKTPNTLVAQPFTRFLRIQSRGSEPAAADTATHFDPQPMAQAGQGPVSWIGSIYLDDQSPSTLAWADEKALHLASGATLPLATGAARPPAGTRPGSLPTGAVAVADFNYDFKSDIAIATREGLRIYQQQDASHFRDITQEAKISADTRDASYTGAWAFDVDLDGDLDLVLGVPQGEPPVLRNNGDGTFTVIHPFHGIDGLTGFAAGDIDGDGDPDVGLIDGGGNFHVLLNQRLGSYRNREVPASVASGVKAIAAGDIDGDGVVDFAVLKNDSSVSRVSEKADSGEWDWAEVIHASAGSSGNLLIGDLDNNGALDIVANDQVFLGNGKGFTAMGGALTGTPRALAEESSNNRLNVLGVNAAGAAIEWMNRGAKNYAWQVIRTRAAHATGDQRINSFGLGGEIELRSDLLAEKQIIAAPVLHFGLGDHQSAQFARIAWPNGFVQAEFDLKADQTILAEQRIKGSCPMLFAWDGRGMQFLKDVGPWGSALGLNVNAQGKGIYGTREWFNIRGDQLAPHDGFYDLRITAEYWETYYMDHYSLLAIDHPADSEVFTDERFALPSPEPTLIGTAMTKPFARATDDSGHDVTEVVRNLDSRFLGNFGLGQYQGLTRDHWVELELPDDAPVSGRLYLIGQGWIHDTDATIVKAQAQNSTAHPEGMSIETPDASGRWATVREGLGFPKGRVKTIILDISDVFRPNAPRKLRLRTNLEIYWDKLAWGTQMPRSERMEVRHLDLASADLRFRGFSLITKAGESSPELPHYDRVEESDLRWRDQEGYATRYGDVRELLERIDDRYVITSPGDELRMKFAALPAPARGSKRDFVLICDGWVKDGDYNSTFAGTILPLPYHAMKDYVQPPTTLEDDYAYKLHPEDWRAYHTRYVTPRYFHSALWGSR
ncbi:MAG: VCBS repeat-containing protein [Acidobacteriaceae bacterium]|nr:VCBS repeat-containing protein [Acidobacteriaceae bacterium]